MLASEHLPHDLVVRYHASWVADPATDLQAGLVLEYLDGEPMHRYADVGGPRALPLGERLRLVERFFRGVQRLHDAHLLHRDLSPRNVMVCAGGRIKFIDFGSAKAWQRPYSSLQSSVGPARTPGYAATEGRFDDPRDDLRPAAAVAFHVLTGAPPEPGATAREPKDPAARDWRAALRRAGLSAASAAVIVKGMLEPDAREALDLEAPAGARTFGSAQAIADSLVAVRAEEERRRRRWRRAGRLALTAAVVVLVAWYGYRRWRAVRTEWLEHEVVATISQLEGVPEAYRQKVAKLQVAGAAKRAEARGLLKGGEPDAAAVTMGEAVTWYRQALARARGFQRAEPLRQVLGKLLGGFPAFWMTRNRPMADRHAALLAAYERADGQLRAGEVTKAWETLTRLQLQTVRFMAVNQVANRAAQARARCEAKLRPIEAGLRRRPAFVAVAAPAEAAGVAFDQAADEAAWTEVERLYGVQLEQIERFVSGLPAAEQARLAKASAAGLEVVERERAELAARLSRIEAERSARVAELAQANRQLAALSRKRLAAEAAAEKAGAAAKRAHAERQTAEAEAKAQRSKLKAVNAAKVRPIEVRLAAAEAEQKKVGQRALELRAALQERDRRIAALRAGFSKGALPPLPAVVVHPVKGFDAARSQCANAFAAYLKASDALVVRIGEGFRPGSSMTRRQEAQLSVASAVPERHVGRQAEDSERPVQPGSPPYFRVGSGP